MRCADSAADSYSTDDWSEKVWKIFREIPKA